MRSSVSARSAKLSLLSSLDDWSKRAKINQRTSGHFRTGRERAVVRNGANLSTETLDRYCRLTYTDRALVTASNACRPASSVGRRPPNFFLAGAAWLEASVFSDLQISNLKSTIRLGWQSGTGQQTTFSSWSISACDPSR